MRLERLIERFQEPIAIQLSQVPEYFKPAPTIGTIQRGDDLKLRMLLHADNPGCKRMTDGPALRFGEMGLAGQFRASAPALEANVEFFAWAEHSKANFEKGEFSYPGPVTAARIAFVDRQPGKRCVVRCANGPEIWGPNSLKVELNTIDYKILIYRTPNRSEEWLCVTLEIESQQVLDESHVESVLTALSFVSGRRIADYEVEFLDNMGQPALIVAHPPHLYSSKEYRESSYCPFQTQPRLLLQDALQWSNLLDLTLQLNKKVSLRNILINVWFSRPLAIGGNLVFYSAALESLVDAWFDLPENKLRSDRLPKSEFLSVISQVISEIQRLEKSDPRWERVRKSIENANQYSGTSKILRFYENHNLRSGAVEEAIRSARHRFAHGADFGSERDGVLLALTYAGEALLNRLILKLANHQGKYVDYSTYGFPMRDLSEPLGGPLGDGNPLD